MTGSARGLDATRGRRGLPAHRSPSSAPARPRRGHGSDPRSTPATAAELAHSQGRGDEPRGNSGSTRTAAASRAATSATVAGAEHRDGEPHTSRAATPTIALYLELTPAGPGEEYGDER